MGKGFVLFLKDRGIHQKLTVHDTLQHNGIAEHFNWIIIEKVWAFLHASGLLRFLWAEAVHHAVWVFNQTLTKALSDGMTPFEAVTRKKPDLKGLRK